MSMNRSRPRVKPAGPSKNTPPKCKGEAVRNGPTPAGSLSVTKLIGARTPRRAALALKEMFLSPIPLLPEAGWYVKDGEKRYADERTPLYDDWASTDLSAY